MPAWATRKATEADVTPEKLATSLHAITRLLPAYLQSLSDEHGLACDIEDGERGAIQADSQEAKARRESIHQVLMDNCTKAYAIAESIGPRLEYGLPACGRVLTQVRFQVARAVRVAFIAEERIDLYVDRHVEPDLAGLWTEFGQPCIGSLSELAELMDNVAVDPNLNRSSKPTAPAIQIEPTSPENNESVYVPNQADRDLFRKIRKLVIGSPGGFRAAGRYLDTRYAWKNINARRRREEAKDPSGIRAARMRREAGMRTARTSSRSVPKGRLMAFVNDVLHDKPDLTTMKCARRIECASWILLATWLLTDPDSGNPPLGLTELEGQVFKDIDDEDIWAPLYRDSAVSGGWLDLVRIAFECLSDSSPMPPDDLITQEQAADLIICASRTIRRRIDDGTLTGYGPERQVSRAEVESKRVEIKKRKPRTRSKSKTKRA